MQEHEQQHRMRMSRRANSWEGLQPAFKSHGSPTESPNLDLLEDVVELVPPLEA